jgi:hypothetical protein
MHDRIGERFAHALATKDAQGLLAVLDPEVDFRGLTPGRFWEASSAPLDTLQSPYFSKR